MSTRFVDRIGEGPDRASRPERRIAADDPAEEVALVARTRRELLLRAHRHQLRREDLEDCFSQATLELVARARRGGRVSSRRHLERMLEQRFVSRMRDRRRALGGRSAMQAALEAAMSFGGVGDDEVEIADVRAELEKLVVLRHELRRIQQLAQRLTHDQRLVLASQVAQQSRSEFCRCVGWSPEKYRKVAQRARARLRQLTAGDELIVPPAAQRSERETGTHL